MKNLTHELREIFDETKMKCLKIYGETNDADLADIVRAFITDLQRHERKINPDLDEMLTTFEKNNQN